MGNILRSYKTNVIEEIIDSISANTSHYYAFGANPIPYANTVPEITLDDYTSQFDFNWNIIFGKKLSNTDIYPMIEKNIWSSNSVYDKYDNTDVDLYDNNNFYVISEPAIVGGVYHIYKCIDNANDSPSTIDPGSIGTPTQSTTFTTGDGYKWRYITTISNIIYTKFETETYAPIYANTNIVTNAKNYCGIDVVQISNVGSNYHSYNNGLILSVVNTNVLQISNTASSENYYYNNTAIYIYNTLLGTSQLRNIDTYIANSSGKWIYLETAANTGIIYPSQSEYIISPRVVFDTDGDTAPIAYCTVNNSTNTIHSINILESGSNISRANVHIESMYGNGAILYAIVPPAGGHGSSPINELNVKGLGITFKFSNTESNTILTSNVNFNKIGVVKNPYILQANNTKGSRYSSNTFNQCVEISVSPSYTFSINETLVGKTSGAKGTVVFANSSYVYVIGDKHFVDGEYLGNTTVSELTQINNIDSIGDIYTKDIYPFYVQNINNINRSNTQNESFKIIIQV